MQYVTDYMPGGTVGRLLSQGIATMKWVALAFLTSLLLAPAAAFAQVAISDPADKQVVEAFLKHVQRVPEQLTAEQCRQYVTKSVEDYTWIVLPYLDMTLTAYQVTGDARYLGMFVGVFANMRSAMTQGPDGFLGWYGTPNTIFQNPDNPTKPIDVIINSFRATDVLSQFVETVQRDPALSRRYARQRQEYLDLIENHLVRKWDVRGNYVDLGPTGGIYRTHFGLKFDKASLTQPHNKHSIIIRAFLALYRATGNDEYMRKAVKVGTRYKHCLTLKDGHYEWHYWDPAGAWDVKPQQTSRWKHWIGVEHKGGYYSSSLSQAVALYQHGVVFDRTDMERFLKTQLEMCWNGDLANPKWARVDGTVSEQYMQGEYMCSALAPFSPRIVEFVYGQGAVANRLENAGHPWQGGPVANGWIGGKLMSLPLAQGGRQAYASFGQAFLSKPENSRFAQSLAFQVTGEGYKAPEVPRQMESMPPEPR